jgi:L-2-hydroxyglutarate oxidase LhgO
MKGNISRVAVVGAGIVGLAVAREIGRRYPDVSVIVFEKEDRVAGHQSGHNSGVVHAGLYYKPGSLKAQLCLKGGRLLREFCAEHQIEVREVGKLIVATSPEETAGLIAIEERAVENRVRDIRRLNRAEMSEIEPFVEGVAGLHSPHTAAVDYVKICEAIAREVESGNGEVRLNSQVTGLSMTPQGVEVRSGPNRWIVDHVVSCAGLRSDQIAEMVGLDGDSRVVPFRGEYYSLRPEVRDRVNGMIYPVPDPRYPFLGIHLTRDFTGNVQVGPNAVLALGLESYNWGQFSARDVARILRWRGSWGLMKEHWRYGLQELSWSLFKHSYVRQVQKYLPSLRSSDLVVSGRGVRAQAVSRRGELIDDFLLKSAGPFTLVLNAPSPAATSSLAIAEHIVGVLSAAS